MHVSRHVPGVHVKCGAQPPCKPKHAPVFSLLPLLPFCSCSCAGHRSRLQDV